VVDEPNVLFNQAVAYYKKNDYVKTRTQLDKVLRLLREKPSASAAQDAELKKRIEELQRRMGK